MDHKILAELENFLKEAHKTWAMDELRAGRNNLDQNDFAKALHVSDVSFNKWYTGLGAPNPDNQKTLSESPYIGDRIFDILQTSRVMPDDAESKIMYGMWRQATTAQRRQFIEILKDMVIEREEEDREQKGGMSVNQVSG